MPCFYVLVHGKLDWIRTPAKAGEVDQPEGFYCHRYVLARTEAEATEKAFHRVRKNLDSRGGWLRNGWARLTLEADELAPAPMYKLLRPVNRGHTFYRDE